MHTIRMASANDVDPIRQLFYNTVNTVNIRDYDAIQIAAWSSNAENDRAWLNKITQQHFMVADNGLEITGFASLNPSGYLDLLYVHQQHQRKGIAKLLASKLETVALKLGLTTLITDASITARPFFEHIGYNTVAQQTVVVKTVELTNFKMIKNLNIL